ncbi:hypothetical protein I204_06301 [Kwoniella mangroviensis CBS 8886]|uniref:uncharacterized protein n=1 Tax=Kwoniella mangroviensis CBS 8507 TaxID=1296122 RepID=UPI00080D54D5|nr:uncharacterized protein I203_06438 [Kwoniella mangroviensis CBS 8507]OCF64257.1 hypothetical protein I203_06438 [Kwoniella mangroviensis CBS 8507]OCF73071.1 hypothetical protein I204_06301 [Kwoniella mangroviensis CBS 8886]
MLSSTRQACVRRLTSSLPYPPALPAESSRQAILRAARVAQAPIRRVHSDSASTSVSRRNSKDVPSSTTRKTRGISSGVTSNAALAYAEDSRSTRYDRRDQSIGITNDDEYTLQPNSDPPTPEWLDSWLYTYDLSTLPPSPLPPLETFRGLVVSQPLLALLTLSTLPQSDLRLIKHHDLRSLMHGCNRVLRERPVLLSRLNNDQVLKSLRILRAILFSLSGGNKGHENLYQGNYFRGKIVRQFLGLCSRLNQLRLYKSVFQDRLREQLSHLDEGVIYFDNIVEDLALTYRWKLIIELFNPDSFPRQYYTSDILAYYLQAHFGIFQLTKIPRLFQLYRAFDLQPTAEAYNHLIQSYLEMGDVPTARDIVREANEKGIADYQTQQLSILRGYRALGYDADIENRVLSDIERLNIPLSARLLNALIRLRMQNGDLTSAKYLAKRFDLNDWTGIQDTSTRLSPRNDIKVKPNLATATLVFDLYSQTGDIEDLRSLWRDMKVGQVGITDQTITTLLRALNGLNLLDEAVSIFEPSLADNEWALPDGVKPDIKSFNYLIGVLGRQRGLKGIESGLALLHEYGVRPDDLTLKIVVDFVRQSIHHTPTELANWVERIMNSSTLKPTHSLLDSIIQSAIKSIARTSKTSRKDIDLLRPSTSSNTFSPTAGLNLSPQFRRSLEGILNALKSVGSTSGSRSLVNRLRYDSMTSSRISNLPSARIVWNSLIQRGYKPDQRHFVALMQGYSDAGLMYQAQDLLGLADQVGCRITKSMLFTLLVGWGKIQRPTESRKIYERIRLMPDPYSKRRVKQVELEIITAMIQAYNNSGQYSEASLMCYTDLRELDIHLDRKAIVVSSQALRGQGDLKGCLSVLEKYGPALDRITRKIVRGVRNYQRKKLVLPVNSPIVSTSTTTDTFLTQDHTQLENLREIEMMIDDDGRHHTHRHLEKLKEDQEILDLSERLLREDDLARPIELRRMTRLNNRTNRALKRALLGEQAVKERNKDLTESRRIYRSDEKRGRVRRRIVRSLKRRLVGGLSTVRIGEVGQRAWKERKNRRRYKGKMNEE